MHPRSRTARRHARAAVASPLAGEVILLWAGAMLLGLALAWPALGQTAVQPPVASPTPGPTMPNPPRDADGRPGGLVRPPAGVDPGIHAPAPDPAPHTTPVIPPPGTPGGNPSLQPR
ncbi:hypothetical protein LPC08_03320 [Roseomonas sp. OT10]|uniref:hypothetical protein n=1 Tax=Roseomonas cutis TaxID=2897332 RepID=UPI001E3D97B2|nr:hypothetical protein [Roseomonas sp. OT10]UFN49689.1 hypothetical protein LPC08_03320 [Roseomonas sp. OT10]